ncbi:MULTISPECIES: hypothetical protein [Streptomyces]|uniref:hypothetical protein n=1 Tax=Streptomyces TaxID=1883 RepID=UPI00342DD6BC
MHISPRILAQRGTVIFEDLFGREILDGSEAALMGRRLACPSPSTPAASSHAGGLSGSGFGVDAHDGRDGEGNAGLSQIRLGLTVSFIDGVCERFAGLGEFVAGVLGRGEWRLARVVAALRPI